MGDKVYTYIYGVGDINKPFKEHYWPVGQDKNEDTWCIQ